jgi:two-component system CheB/CheR fusion protein
MMQFVAKLRSILKTPEVQFFIIFTIPFVGFVLINYAAISPMYKLAVILLSSATLIIVFMQALYGIHEHARAAKQAAEFLSMTAHQIRTPLTAVRWTLQELSKKDVREEDRNELIRVASGAGERISSIVDAFAEAARIEDSIDFHFGNVDLGEVIERAVQETQATAKQYGVSVYFEDPGHGIGVWADASKLNVVVSNLVNNAIKYNHKGGIVTIKARPLLTDKVVQVSIEDTGMGISADDKKQLFQKYFRTAAAKGSQKEGTGLGLYLAKQIIEKHKGRITVESTLGQGSTFYFTLPIEQ